MDKWEGRRDGRATRGTRVRIPASLGTAFSGTAWCVCVGDGERARGRESNSGAVGVNPRLATFFTRGTAGTLADRSLLGIVARFARYDPTTPHDVIGTAWRESDLPLLERQGHRIHHRRPGSPCMRSRSDTLLVGVQFLSESNTPCTIPYSYEQFTVLRF